MPFTKGQSGNPNGRTPKYATDDERKLAQRAAYERWRAAHVTDDRERARVWREEHLEIARKNARLYQQKYPDKIKAVQHRRRARKRGNGGSYTAEEWRALCDRYGNACLCCGGDGPLVVDHVVPLARGGTNDITNLQPLCTTCNNRKHTKIIDYRA